MCKCSFKHVKPGFRLCLWCVDGIKSTWERVFRAWAEAGDNYTTFDEVVSGMISYHSLLNIAKPLHFKKIIPVSNKVTTVNIFCDLCHGDIRNNNYDQKIVDEVTLLQCEHTFHTRCINDWQIHNPRCRCSTCKSQ
jgi:hypothetical protein